MLLPAHHSTLYRGCFVGGEVVHHQIRFEFRRHVCFDRVEKLAKLAWPLAALELADELAALISMAENKLLAP